MNRSCSLSARLVRACHSPPCGNSPSRRWLPSWNRGSCWHWGAPWRCVNRTAAACRNGICNRRRYPGPCRIHTCSIRNCPWPSGIPRSGHSGSYMRPTRTARRMCSNHRYRNWTTGSRSGSTSHGWYAGRPGNGARCHARWGTSSAWDGILPRVTGRWRIQTDCVTLRKRNRNKGSQAY